MSPRTSQKIEKGFKIEEANQKLAIQPILKGLKDEKIQFEKHVRFNLPQEDYQEFANLQNEAHFEDHEPVYV